MQRWEVTAQDSGTKLTEFLKHKLGGQYSVKSIKRELDQSRCFLNGRPERFGTALVGAGDIVELHIAPTEVPEGNILYEDAQFLIYDKPPYVTVESLEKTLKQRLVHRLDKDTTGALILAKDKETFAAMVREFKNKKVQKTYLALVDGVPMEKQGTVENYLGKQKEWEGQSVWGAVDSKQGQQAITQWKCMRKGSHCALVECKPITGRTHQIRTHMASIGHPILGDWQYSQKFICKYHPPRILLHALRLSFHHPITHATISVEAPLPADFVEAMEILSL